MDDASFAVLSNAATVRIPANEASIGGKEKKVIEEGKECRARVDTDRQPDRQYCCSQPAIEAQLPFTGSLARSLSL